MIAAFDWSGIADWLCTFALHSTCALLLAWLLSAILRRRAVAVQEQVLRFSLWAALLSSSLQFFALGGPWPAGLSLRTAPTSDSTPALLGLAVDPALEAADFAVATMAPVPAELPWALLVVAAAITFALFGLGWLWSVHRGLQNVLASREPETDARVLTTAAEVARQQGLRQSPHVSRCSGLATPIAFGWMRPEICLPLRAVELSGESLRAMLAHEVAHLRRCDPAWMWLAALLQAVFPWQALLFVVRRRWSRLVELRCDAIAAHQSSPTAVARCLLDVAEWLRPGRNTPLVALGMAARASSLRERVEAALQPRDSRPPHRFVSMGFGAASLSALTFAGPGVHSDVPPVAAWSVESPIDGATPDAPAPTAPDSPLLAAVLLLEAERAALVTEAQQLRATLRAGPSSAELELLMATLQSRLAGLERQGERLRAWLGRSIQEAR